MSEVKHDADTACRRLLEHLADGRFHSGEAVSAALGYSRAYLWKLVSRLRAEGLQVDAVRGRGYRLPYPVELLDAVRIAELADAQSLGLTVEVVDKTPSTNQLLLERAHAATRPCAVLAERQFAGRGRWGRSWQSPFGGGLATSLLWPFPAERGLAGLSLAVAVALAEGLEELGVESIGLKWPNDLQVRGAKLGGILVEVVGEAAGPLKAVIGWGLNVCLPASAKEEIGQRVTDFYTLLGHEGLQRNRIAGALIGRVARACQIFQEEGFEPFRQRWPRFDVLYEQSLVLHLPDGLVEGRGLGVDAEGALVIESPSGQRSYFTGETELKVRR